MHSAAIQRMRTIQLPKSNAANIPGPPSSYAGSGMSLHPHGAVPHANPHSSVSVLEKLREVRLPKRQVEEVSESEDDSEHDVGSDSDVYSNSAEEEKKYDGAASNPNPYNPDKPEIFLLNSETMAENKIPLDMRLVMGLPSKETIIARRSVSPPQSSSRPSSQEKRPTSKEILESRLQLGVVQETTQEVPHTHSQLMAQLKKKHEFSEMLENVVPSDISREKSKSEARGRQRRREKRRKRERREKSSSLSHSPPARGSLSPPPPPGGVAPPSDLEAESYASSIFGRAKTAKRGKRAKNEAEAPHDPSALSLYSEDAKQQQHVYQSQSDEYSSGDDFYESGDQFEASGDSYHSDVVESIMKRPWSEEDRARRRKETSVSPVRRAAGGVSVDVSQAKKPFDKFQRPTSNARWDYDEYGYLWADDESFQHEKDKGALEKKKRFGKNRVDGERYKGLVEAYGDSVVPRERKRRRKKGHKNRPDDFAGASSSNNNNNFAFAPPQMEPTGGSTTLPPILPSDASRSVFSQSLPMNNYRLRTKQKGVTSYDSQFESLDIQHAVVQHHVYDLKFEENQQRHKESAIQLGIVWEIEKMKAQLPMAFLQQWGLGGDVAVNKSIKIIIRVINRIRHSTIWVWFKRWRNEINAQIEIEFNAKMLLFQQGDALKTFEAIGRRCLRYAALSGLRQWKKQIEKWKFQEEMGEMDGAARVIQRYIKIRQHEQQSMNSMRAVVEVVLHNRRQITMFLKFEGQVDALVEHHKVTLAIKKKEDNAAAVIRRGWLSSRSRGAIDRLILLTRDRKRIERLALENKMARVVQRCWRARKDRMGLWQFRLARRKRLEQERKQAELRAQEARMGLQVQRMRSRMAAVIQKNYRTHLFIMRFNKKAYERKKAKLAQQLLEHKKAKIIQRNYRTYRFLMTFNQKAHQRKLRWMKEAEEQAKREYDAACFLQDC
ncbi:hypothetical protein TrST_g7524 [Triparma strigata]|uniref:Uncharacterized protein n=1 Tax=Triparma strigata TaxID=1606541 RepID=A0A9W7A0R2_9STRA|nr:hypothetical protein TrST_g7524 [Triparma strigata]